MRAALFLSTAALLCTYSDAQVSSLAPADGNSETRRRSADYSPLAAAPEKARARCNPLAGNGTAIAAGRKLFAQHCAECHGKDAEGSEKAPSLREKEVQQATAGTLFWLITNGVVRRGMPVWSRLPEPQRWQIISYIQTLNTTVSAPAPVAPGSGIPCE